MLSLLHFSSYHKSFLPSLPSTCNRHVLNHFDRCHPMSAKPHAILKSYVIFCVISCRRSGRGSHCSREPLRSQHMLSVRDRKYCVCIVPVTSNVAVPFCQSFGACRRTRSRLSQTLIAYRRLTLFYCRRLYNVA